MMVRFNMMCAPPWSTSCARFRDFFGLTLPDLSRRFSADFVVQAFGLQASGHQDFAEYRLFSLIFASLEHPAAVRTGLYNGRHGGYSAPRLGST
jgi:hypothetical protein